MTAIKHIITIWLALEHYKEWAEKDGKESLEEDIQDTQDWLINKEVTEITKLPLGVIK